MFDRSIFAPKAHASGLRVLLTVLLFGALLVGVVQPQVALAAPPDAGPINVQTNEDTAVNIPTTPGAGNDVFLTNNTPAHGQAVVNGDTIVYTPGTDETATVTIGYEYCDGNSQCGAEGTITVTIVAENDAPVANPDGPYTLNEDGVFNLPAPGILGNDTDAESNPLTAIKASDPANGTLVWGGDGSFAYIPDPDYNGPDSFTYKANDGVLDSNVATVNLTVDAVLDEPELSLLTTDFFVDPPNSSITVPIVLDSMDVQDDISFANFSLDYDMGGNGCLNYISFTDVPASFTANVGQTGTELTVVISPQTLSPPFPGLPDGPIIGLQFGVDANCFTTVSNPFGMDFDFIDIDLFDNNGVDVGGLGIDDTVMVQSNSDPTDFDLDPTDINENAPVGTVIGELKDVVDADLGTAHGDSHSFSWGSDPALNCTDNGRFTIDGATNELKSAEIFDAETQGPFDICVKVTDSYGGTYEEDFVINILDINDPPTDIDLNPNNKVGENRAIGTVVGTFDSDPYDQDDNDLDFTLVPGAGDTDNGRFTIDPATDELKTAEKFDFETQGPFSIRVQADDGNGGTFQKQFDILINDRNDKPSAITIDNDSIPVGSAQGTKVGTLSTEDQDTADTHTYTIISVEDSGGVAELITTFQINGSDLEAGTDFGGLPVDDYDVTIETDDGGKQHQETLTISVVPPNTPPTAVDDPNGGPAIVIVGSDNINVLGNDGPDPDGDTITIDSVDDSGSDGSVTNNGTDVTYTANPSLIAGMDMFDYTITDGNGGMDTATVTLNYVAAHDRGDCNGNGTVEPGDFQAVVLEIFDTDSDPNWYNIFTGGFTGSPLGCDANGDEDVNSGDILCTVLIYFGNGTHACAGPVVASGVGSTAALSIDGDLSAAPGETVNVPVRLSGLDNSIAGANFTLTFDEARFSFDAATGISLNLPDGAESSVDATTGTIQIAVYDLDIPMATLTDGVIATISLQVKADAEAGESSIGLSDDAALGNLAGQSVSVSTNDGIVTVTSTQGTEQLDWSIYLPFTTTN